jgi:hypothetical protein
MSFARRVFFGSGIYGIVVLVPMFFLEARIGREFPPATNHPEQYYGLLGVALAWQLAFLVIAGDPIRYRPLMLPAVLEKWLAGGAALWLLAVHRIDAVAAGPFFVDLVLGALFLASYLRTARHPAPPGAG